LKSGIDYFPLDVVLDSKFELIEAEFGLIGFGIVVKLYQKIYAEQGYYLEWTNEVALLFAKRIGMGGSVVSEIVEASIKRGIFDKDLYEKYHVLTSRGIQKRYFEAVSRRKEIEIDMSILLVDPAQICKNVDIKPRNVNNPSKNADIFQQSKVKKSRVEKSKEKNDTRGEVVVDTGLDFAEVFKTWEKASALNPTPMVIEELGLLMQEYGKDNLCSAIKTAADQGKVTLAYVKGILRNNADGTTKKSKADIDQEKAERIKQELREEDMRNEERGNISTARKGG